MRALYLDCFAGISGNMLLGSLLDVGVPENYLRSELAKLQLTGYDLVIQRVEKSGISANYVDVQLTHHQHHHRHLPDIIDIIDNSSLELTIKENSKKIFLRLAEAEAKVHGTGIDHIHFHEVGAVDAIIDIVGTMIGFHYLGIEKIYVSKLQVGSGFIQCSHGMMPVPAPATAELLKKVPYYAGKIEKELVTPTGAAIITALDSEFGSMPEQFSTDAIGYGAGTWELDIPNVLRMHYGMVQQQASNEVMIVEANIDDLNPQIYGFVMDKLFAAGALDVWMTPVIMKKSRPAVLFSVMIQSHQLPAVTELLFRETSTIGIRYSQVARTTAFREVVSVESPWGLVRAKVSRYQGRICNITPEYEDCKKVAENHQIALKKVQQIILERAHAEYAQ
ncbi:MAG: nickel pincer cofactor biosynthesis protein LarC [Veillonellales bacterium]